MKNLFDYATKELTQDAFLRWLFENHDDRELGELTHELLKQFCEFSNDEKVKTLTSSSQEHKIDLSFRIETTAGRNIAIFIEDKTFSNEHNQLTIYDEYIESLKDKFNYVYKIYYKTNLLNDLDQNGLKEANNKNLINWKPFDIDKIVSLFEKYANSKNQILSQYAQYVKSIRDLLHSTQKPKDSANKKDLLAWQAYFNNKIIPSLQGNRSQYTCGVWRAGQYPYMCFVITKRGYGVRRVPYLEIRSRDCSDNRFQARILCYGVSDEDLASQQQKLIDNIKKIDEFVCKGLVQSHKGKTIFPKQVGYSEIKTDVETDKQFLSLVEKYISLYLQAMRDWT